MTDAPRDPLARCHAALLVALEDAIAAEAAGQMTPEVGVILVGYIQAAVGAAVLAGDVEVTA